MVLFRGRVLTGWSRYDHFTHFTVLCELLPPAIPSLILNLVVVSEDGGLTPDLVSKEVYAYDDNIGKPSPGEFLRRGPRQRE